MHVLCEKRFFSTVAASWMHDDGRIKFHRWHYARRAGCLRRCRVSQNEKRPKYKSNITPVACTRVCARDCKIAGYTRKRFVLGIVGKHLHRFSAFTSCTRNKREKINKTPRSSEARLHGQRWFPRVLVVLRSGTCERFREAQIRARNRNRAPCAQWTWCTHTRLLLCKRNRRTQRQ